MEDPNILRSSVVHACVCIRMAAGVLITFVYISRNLKLKLFYSFPYVCGALALAPAEPLSTETSNHIGLRKLTVIPNSGQGGFTLCLSECTSE